MQLNQRSPLLLFLTFVKMGGSGSTGPKGGTSSLAVTDTCEGEIQMDDKQKEKLAELSHCNPNSNPGQLQCSRA